MTSCSTTLIKAYERPMAGTILSQYPKVISNLASKPTPTFSLLREKPCSSVHTASASAKAAPSSLFQKNGLVFPARNIYQIGARHSNAPVAMYLPDSNLGVHLLNWKGTNGVWSSPPNWNDCRLLRNPLMEVYEKALGLYGGKIKRGIYSRGHRIAPPAYKDQGDQGNQEAVPSLRIIQYFENPIIDCN